MAVIFAIGLVLAGEGINSAIERLSDVVQPERDDRIRDVKDISAGAVLIFLLSPEVLGTNADGRFYSDYYPRSFVID